MVTAAQKTDDRSGSSELPEQINWPDKYDLFGVHVSVTTYDECVERIMQAAQRRQSALVTFMPVHGLVTAATDAGYRTAINDFDIVAPDGQPVRWALNQFHQAGLTDRVYGPQTTLLVCREAARRGVGVYLYGSTDEVLDQLTIKLTELCPGLKIVGHQSPPFRAMSQDELQQAVDRINASGAGIVMVGLGCPRQDFFAREHRDAIRAVQMCVGAAFDFHAGNKKMAPAWMQKKGLEWLFRLTQEPGRLWRRYLVTNSIFLFLCAREYARRLSQSWHQPPSQNCRCINKAAEHVGHAHKPVHLS